MKEVAKWVGLVVGALVLYVITSGMSELTRWGFCILGMLLWTWYHVLKRFDEMKARLSAMEDRLAATIRDDT